MLTAGSRPNPLVTLVAVLALVLFIPGCGGTDYCPALPCALPIAITLQVSAQSSAGPVPGATVDVSGPLGGTLPCDSSCSILGPPGSYSLTVSAPGYQSTQRTVDVTGSVPSCGCATSETQDVSVALAPTP